MRMGSQYREVSIGYGNYNDDKFVKIISMDRVIISEGYRDMKIGFGIYNDDKFANIINLSGVKKFHSIIENAEQIEK